MRLILALRAVLDQGKFVWRAPELGRVISSWSELPITFSVSVFCGSMQWLSQHNLALPDVSVQI